jgi:HAD superfamily hydrolase (TIGR01509 family)
MMHPKFFYFDLGNVMVDFAVAQMLRQMGDVAGIEPAQVLAVVMESGLQRQYELGQLSMREFYEGFCAQIRKRPDFDALMRASNEIFSLNPAVAEVVRALHRSGYRLGILSNTCPNHWEYCMQQFPVLRECFAVPVLSYEVHARKPDAAIFQVAAELAGHAPHEIFFTDDILEHVVGARAVGFDAVQYTSAPELIAEVRKRGVLFEL